MEISLLLGAPFYGSKMYYLTILGVFVGLIVALMIYRRRQW